MFNMLAAHFVSTKASMEAEFAVEHQQITIASSAALTDIHNELYKHFGDVHQISASLQEKLLAKFTKYFRIEDADQAEALSNMNAGARVDFARLLAAPLSANELQIAQPATSEQSK